MNPDGNHMTTRRAWLIVALLCVFMFITFADRAMLGLAGTQIADELGLSPFMYGVVASSFYLLLSVSAIAVGFLATRVDARRIVFVLALVWTVAQLSAGLLPGLAVLVASRILLGSGEGPAYPLAAHLTHCWFPNRTRHLPTSLLAMSASLGGIVAVPVITVIIVYFGWRSGFVALGVASLAWSGLWLQWGTGRQGTQPYPPEPARRSDARRIPYRKIFTTPTWLATTAAAFTGLWCVSLLVTWVPTYLEKVGHYSATRAGLLYALPWLAAGIWMPLSSAICRSLAARGWALAQARLTVIAGGLIAASVCTLAMTRLHSGPAQVAMLTLAAMGYSNVAAIFPVICAELVPPGQRSAVLGTTTGLANLGALLAPAVMGWIVQAGDTVAAGLTNGFAVTAVLLVAGGLVAARWIRPERDRGRLAWELLVPDSRRSRARTRVR
jgi:MFS family permease